VSNRIARAFLPRPANALASAGARAPAKVESNPFSQLQSMTLSGGGGGSGWAPARRSAAAAAPPLRSEAELRRLTSSAVSSPSTLPPRAAPDADIFATGGSRSYATHAHVRADPAAAVFGGGRAGGLDAELEEAYGGKGKARR
jgi:hypothetical protein